MQASPKRGRPTTRPYPYCDLAHAVGGVARLCEKLGGIDYSSLHRWAKNLVKPHPREWKALIRLCDRYDVEAPVEPSGGGK